MSFDLRTGDTREIVKTLPSESVQLIVTSPPYWKQRDYGLPFQMGDEETPEAFTEALVDLFREWRRVLRTDGLAFVNLGTSYVGGNARAVGNWKDTDAVPNAWLFGLAARADGWYLRSELIWEKTNPKPSSVKNRWSLSHETVVMLAKERAYFSDIDAVREPYSATSLERSRHCGWRVRNNHGVHQPGGKQSDYIDYVPNVSGRIRRSVIRTNAPSFDDEHTASYPPELVEPMILFGTSEAGACRSCGAPLMRVVAEGEPLREVQRASGGNEKGEYRGKSTRDYRAEKAEVPSDIKARTLASMTERKTIGWRRPCSCDPKSGNRPCLVADPFGGTHTTGEVAVRFGRDYLGIEGDAGSNKRARARLKAAASQPHLKFAVEMP